MVIITDNTVIITTYYITAVNTVYSRELYEKYYNWPINSYDLQVNKIVIYIICYIMNNMLFGLGVEFVQMSGM